MKDMENPLEGLDISSLGTPNFGGEGNNFEVRDGNEGVSPTEPVEDPVDENITPETVEEDPFGNNNSIGLRDFDDEGNEIPLEEEGFIEEPNEEDPSVFFKALSEKGFIDLEDGDLEDDSEKDLEWLIERASKRKEKELNERIEEYKETLPDEIKNLLDTYEEGVPLGALLEVEKKAFDYNTIKDEDLEVDENLQKNLIIENLKRQGESYEDIEDLIQDYDDSGLLEKQARRALTRIKKHEEFKKKQFIEQEKAKAEQEKNQYNEWLTSLKKNIWDKEEIIPGLEMNEKQKKELYNGITKVDRQGKNAIMRYREENPDFDLQVAYLATIMKGDFSSLVAAAETKAARNLKEKASSKGGSGSSKRSSNSKGVGYSIMRNALKI